MVPRPPLSPLVIILPLFFFFFLNVHLSQFVLSVILGRIPYKSEMVTRLPSHDLVITPLFSFLFLFKVQQTSLKSVQLAQFVLSVILGRIPKSLKIVPRLPPLTLVFTPLFFFFSLKSSKPLKKVCTFHHLTYRLFWEGYLEV